MKHLHLFFTGIFLFLSFIVYSQCGIDSTEVTIKVHTDSYGSETTWTLKHASGAPTYASGGPYADISGGQLYTHQVCVPKDVSMTFRINDAYGDGICCSYGNGFYEVELFGFVYAYGGQFGSYEETTFMSSEPLARDMGVVDTDMFDYYEVGNISLIGKVKSFGGDTVTSYTINYAVNNAAPVSHTFSSVSILPFTTVNFAHPIPFNATSSGVHNVKLWTSNINNDTDLNPDNDTLEIIFTVVSQVPEKYVLIEQATGAWCGYCPDGSVRLEQILQTNPNAIGVAIHNGDAMAFTNGNTVNSTYITGYPQGMIDRYKFSDLASVGMSRTIWAAKTNERKIHISPVAVGVSNTYNPTTRVVTITVNATFYADLNEQIRFNCYIVEDSLSGTGTGWNQSNAYNATSGHPMQGMGNPIVGYKHRHVLTAMLGGPFGTVNSIPATIVDGQTYTKEYTYTLPAGAKEKDIKIVGLVQQYNANINNRTILNSKQVPLNIIGSVPSMDFVTHFSVFPNPVSHQANIEFSLNKTQNVSVKLYNVLGQEVYNAALGNLQEGAYKHSIDVNGMGKGIYSCVVNFGSHTLVEKLIVQ